MAIEALFVILIIIVFIIHLILISFSGLNPIKYVKNVLPFFS